MSRPESLVPSDAILTLPNLVTFARLGLIPLFLYLGIDAHNIAACFATGAIAGGSDFLDGKLARKLGQVSKLGIALDPLSDRLLVAAGAVVLIVDHFAPLWAVLLVLARDALVLAAVPFVAKRGVERPAVSWWGKAATTGVFWSFGMWTGANFGRHPIRWMQIFGWACYVPAIVFSFYSAFGYAREVRRLASAA
ncbi:MAG: CDP-alcohol phosphatidyltransferase family protein [Actinomycetota bacterium]